MGKDKQYATPHWLPKLEYKDPLQDFRVYEDYLYLIFKSDFIDSHPYFRGLRVSVRRQKEESDGKWAGFFHITSVEDKNSGERVVDLRRCERIRFPRKTIEHYDSCPFCHYQSCDKPLTWTERKRGKCRFYILIESERYLVVLEPHQEKGYCMLVTAYYVDQEHSYEKLLKQYKKARAAAATQETPSTTW